MLQTVLTAGLVAALYHSGPWLDAHIPPEWRATCIRWLLSTNLLALSLCLYFLRRARLRLHFGLLWDRNLNPHCPRCRVPLANRAKRTGAVIQHSDPSEQLMLRDTMQCFGCDRFLYPDLDHLPAGQVRDFANARRLLRGEPPQRAAEGNSTQ